MLKKLVNRSLQNEIDRDSASVSVGPKKKNVKLMDPSILQAIQNFVVEKRKISAKELYQFFEHYDPDETGQVKEDIFQKCLTKIGIKLNTDQLQKIMDCFSAPTNKLKKGGKQQTLVNYYNFVDYITCIRDTEALSAVGENIRHAIKKYDKTSEEQPLNMMSELQKLDAKKRSRLKTETFQEYITDHSLLKLALSKKELKMVVDRFKYEYENGTFAIDYEQFAKWIQPSMHLDVKGLNQLLQKLFVDAKKQLGLDSKMIFKEFDNDGSGTITKMELKEALHQMGLPLTDTQIYCLVDEYDTNGDGKIQYKEFLQFFSKKNDSDEEETDNDKVESRNKSKAKKSSKGMFIGNEVLDSIEQVVRMDNKKNTTDLCEVFEKYDKHELGYVTEADFTKGLSKIGLKIKKDQIANVLDAFRKPRTKSNSKKPTIDYYSFVDYITQSKDTDKLSQIGDKLRDRIAKHDKKSEEQPYNILNALEKLDKKTVYHIKPSMFHKFLESNSVVDFDLSSKEIKAIVSRFQYEYKRSMEIDYDQFARWVQPSMHLDTDELHARVKHLFAVAKKKMGLDCKAIFEEIDDDGNGHITRMEMKDPLYGMGMPLTDTQIKCLVDEYDMNGDGKIQYKEFAKFFSEKFNEKDSKSGRGEEISESSSEHEKPEQNSLRKRFASRFRIRKSLEVDWKSVDLCFELSSQTSLSKLYYILKILKE